MCRKIILVTIMVFLIHTVIAVSQKFSNNEVEQNDAISGEANDLYDDLADDLEKLRLAPSTFLDEIFEDDFSERRWNENMVNVAQQKPNWVILRAERNVNKKAKSIF